MRAALDDRPVNKLLLALDRQLVGAAGGRDDGDDKANHRDRNDRGDGDDHLQPRKIDARPLAVPGVVCLRREAHTPTLGVFWRRDDRAKKIAIRLRLMQAKSYRHDLKPLQELTRRKAELSDSEQARKNAVAPRQASVSRQINAGC